MCMVILTIISGIAEMTYFGSGEQSTMQNIIASFGTLRWNNPLMWLTSSITVIWNSILFLANAITFNYSFFQGDWAIIRYAFFLPISLGFVVSIAFAIRGASGS